MPKKSFRLFTATLLLSLSTLLGGCGHSSNSSEAEAQIVEQSVVQEPNIESSRFYAERIEISGNFLFLGRGGETNRVHSPSCYSYIITDNVTGQQFLYIYTVQAQFGSTATINEIINNTDE